MEISRIPCFSVCVSSPLATRTVTLRRAGNVVYLNVCACGTLMIFR